MGIKGWLGGNITNFLNAEKPPPAAPLCDFEKLRFELRPSDVILVEGRSRVSEVIKLITQSSWTHSMLYLGRLADIDDPQIRLKIRQSYSGDPSEQLLIEALIGQGTIVVPLSRYRDDHLRICRPRGVSRQDAQAVIAYAAARLGVPYDMRQILDLARFLMPWAIFPRRWRSSLFERRAGAVTRTVCSTLLVEAFASVNFPVLPVVEPGVDGGYRLYPRNARLFAPRDFDYSPYFDIIKYPFVAFGEAGLYRRLPWQHGVVCNEEGDCVLVAVEHTDGSPPSAPPAGEATDQTSTSASAR